MSLQDRSFILFSWLVLIALYAAVPFGLIMQHLIDLDTEAVKIKDHIQIRVDDGKEIVTIIVALPDSARYAYIGLTGDNCRIYDVGISAQEETVPMDYIPRIAPEISYISGPAGDVPNVQMDGYRTDYTLGIPVRDGMKITFHAMSLPTARLVWHTAYLDLFYSPDQSP